MTRLSQAIQSVVHGGAAGLKGFVRDLNSTTWTIFTGTLVGAATVVAYFALVELKRPVPLDSFVALLAFEASWIGFGVRQFRHKRESFQPGGPQDKEPS